MVRGTARAMCVTVPERTCVAAAHARGTRHASYATRALPLTTHRTRDPTPLGDVALGFCRGERNGDAVVCVGEAAGGLEVQQEVR